MLQSPAEVLSSSFDVVVTTCKFWLELLVITTKRSVLKPRTVLAGAVKSYGQKLVTG